MSSSAPLVAIEVMAVSIWVGGMVCIAVVARVARDALDEVAQVAFFRSLGRRYAMVGMTSLLVAIAAGLALSWSSVSSSRTIDAVLSLAGILLVATMFGMRQARAMTTLRLVMIANPTDSSVANSLHRGRRLANAIRALMAFATFAIVFLGAWIVTR
ncbi:MAG TPA: hypothetical protein VIJ86_04440 [Acidimicrobiales bacterium]